MTGQLSSTYRPSLNVRKALENAFLADLEIALANRLAQGGRVVRGADETLVEDVQVHCVILDVIGVIAEAEVDEVRSL